MVTRVLGHKPCSVLGSPTLIFNKTVSGCLGPRFSYVRQHMPESGTRWSPSTLVRSKDRVSAPCSHTRSIPLLFLEYAQVMFVRSMDRVSALQMHQCYPSS